MNDTTVAAGPELNAQVRRAIFGPNRCGLHPRGTPPGDWCSHLPDYSRDIKAAWTICDRMRDMGLIREMWGSLYVDLAERGVCRMEEAGYALLKLTSPEVAAVICRAALRALAAHQEAPGHD